MKLAGLLAFTLLVCQIAILEAVLGEDAADKQEKIDAKWLQKNIIGFGPSIPDGIVELHARIRPLLKEGVGPELIEVGTMKSNKWHFVIIRFVNMFDKPIRVADVASSCGCLVAGNGQEVIETKSEGFVIGIVKPQDQPGVYQKSLTITFDNGLVWSIMLSGYFETEFQFDRDFIKIDSLTQEVVLVVSRMFGDRELANLNFKSQGGYLSIRKTEFIDTDQVRLTFSVPVETKRSSVGLSERLLVLDKSNGERICEMVVGIDVVPGIQCRPRHVLLRKDGDCFSGMLYLVGDMGSSLDDLECVLRSETGIPLEVTIVSKGRSGAEILIKTKCDRVASTRGEVMQVVVVVNDQVVCDDLKLSFFGE